jgi:predicted nuclease with TOPRIM domain
MNNSADPTTGLVTRHSLAKWLDEMQDVLKGITDLTEEADRHRTAAEATQREIAELRVEAARIQDECGKLGGELSRLRAEVEHHRSIAESGQRETQELRESVAALQLENDRLRGEQAEAGETAAKLLGEMKELVNQVAHKFQGSPRTSPFAREPKSPHA